MAGKKLKTIHYYIGKFQKFKIWKPTNSLFLYFCIFSSLSFQSSIESFCRLVPFSCHRRAFFLLYITQLTRVYRLFRTVCDISQLNCQIEIVKYTLVGIQSKI